MAGGQPGSNSRGRGGKFRKFTRGGGKHFSRDLRPVDSEGNEISMWSEDARKKKEGNDGDDEEEEEDDDEDSDEDSDDAGHPDPGATSREDRKKEKKARKEAALARAKGQAVQVGDLPPSGSESDDSDDGMPANPNHSRAARSQAKGPSDSVAADATDGVKSLSIGTPSRKERESLEAQQAKERYRKLHEQGKTDEAKADLARLKLIREKREAEAARKQAEKEERQIQEAAKKAEIDAKEAKKREAALGPKARGKGKN